ncbi:DUF481 domain-containing protein [Spirosoma areae]
MRLQLYLLFLMTTQPALAQLNESDTTLFQVRVSLTGNSQQGNVEVLNLRSKLDFTVAPTRDLVFKSQNSSLYQEFYSTKADNDLFSRNYLYFRPYQRVYPFAIGYVSTNFRRKIDLRYFVGAGATVQVWKTRQNVLKLSVSAIYEATRFTVSDFNETIYNGSRTIALWRGTAWLGGWHYLLDNHLRLYYDAFYQPAFSDAANYRWQADVGFDFPIWRGLAFNALYTYTHENVVVTKIRPDDKLLTIGLSYNLRRNHHP